MQNLQEIETGLLVDLLAHQTALLTTKIQEKNIVEIQQYQYDIAMIQAELYSRQKINFSSPDVEFN